MKKLSLLISCATLLWSLPLLVAAGISGEVRISVLVIAGVVGLVQVALLLPGFMLALRLDRRPVARGAGWGAVSGAVLAIVPHVVFGLPIAIAVVSGCATGALIAGLLRLEVEERVHWFPRARADRRPSHWWYWGRALYVSRRDYGRIFLAFLAVGVPLGVAGLAGPRALFDAAVVVAVIGLALFMYSLFGLYRMYGHPSLRYYKKLLEQGGVRDGAVLADLHIGTYRTAFAIADLLPHATIHSIDCWDTAGPPAEPAVADVRDLEPPPTANARIVPARASANAVPLASASCDAVVFGFGTHEISTGGPREQLFAEARRILKPGGVALLFEHGYDLHNYLIFGPVIDHVTRRADWLQTMRSYFTDVSCVRSSAAVDMLAGRRHA